MTASDDDIVPRVGAVGPDNEAIRPRSCEACEGQACDGPIAAHGNSQVASSEFRGGLRQAFIGFTLT